MKRMIMIGMTLLLMTGSPAIAWASEFEEYRDSRETKSSGFSARIDMGGSWKNTESHLEPGDDNKRLYSLTQAAKSESRFEPEMSFELDYDFGNGLGLYMAMPLENEQRPTLGMRYASLRYGEINFSLFYGLPDKV